MREIDCAFVEEHDLAALYLAGRLAESDAEAFEAHQLGCDRCSAELAQAGEIRSALGKPVLIPAALESLERSTGGQDVWTVLATAAAVAVFAIGIRELSTRREMTAPESVYRGAVVDVLPVQVSAADGGVRLSWTPKEDAQTYVVRIIASDSTSVFKRETAASSVTIDAGTLAARPGVSFLARIEALDPMGQVVARSASTPLPRR